MNDILSDTFSCRENAPGERRTIDNGQSALADARTPRIFAGVGREHVSPLLGRDGARKRFIDNNKRDRRLCTINATVVNISGANGQLTPCRVGFVLCTGTLRTRIAAASSDSVKVL